ncbi:MAG: ureidoglycolate lyase [Acidimicrobiia bacterium]
MSTARRIVVEAAPLTPETWAPFGWLPVLDTDPADGDHTLSFAWADPHLNVITHASDEVEHTDDGPVCARLYRHRTHTQALMPLNCAAVVAVAPASLAFAAADDVGEIRAFRLAPQDVFVLHAGTWHWGPFPIGDEPVCLLNVQGRRYSEDNAYVELGPLGVEAVVRS